MLVVQQYWHCSYSFEDWRSENFKDTLFRKIFDNKKDLLSLYNALNDTELYKGYIERNGLRIYNETPVKLPFPRYIVFYNGRDGEPETRVMPLSDSYITNDSNKDQEPCLE